MGFALTYSPVLCQNFEFLEIPFYKNGEKIPNPTTGGLKNPMFSNFDFNGDGKKDLLIFDREGEVALPFIYRGIENELDYVYDHAYSQMLPKLRVFALAVDFNHDGIEDIFTGGYVPTTIEVYRGKRVNGTLQFTQVTFGFDGSLGNFLQIYLGGYSQIYSSSIDVPSITDVDNDGDVDIVTFQAGSDKLTYYQNMSKEQNLSVDSLVYRINTACWGGFKEDEFAADVYLSDNIEDCFNFHGPDKGEVRHSGSTTLLLDIDGDGDKDLLLGDLTNEYIKLLVNHGTAQKAWMNSVDHTFPSTDQAAHMQVFLAAYHVDVNNDGKRDLIVTPNDRNDSERKNHIWLYMNHSQDAAPVFTLHTKSFLIDHTISLGSGSHPCFVDYDLDGLTDLIIGGNGIIEFNGDKKTWIEYYKNTGTKENPVFSLVSDDFLGFSVLSEPALRLAPNTGDLDGDGDFDIMVGAFDGWLYYFENSAGANQPPVFDTRIYKFADIYNGNNAKPFMKDMNGDGLTDLVIGKLNNNLAYYQNQGSVGNAVFTSSASNLPNQKNIGNLFQQPNSYFLESGAPFYLDAKEGRLFAFGTQGGGVRLYKVPGTDMTKPYELVDELLGNIYTGSRSVPSFSDIDNDGYYELVLGNERGGISFYNTNIQTDKVSNAEIHEEKPLTFHPNPANNVLFYTGIKPDAIKLWDVMGMVMNISWSQHEIFVENLPSGMYFLEYLVNRKRYVEKIWIQK